VQFLGQFVNFLGNYAIPKAVYNSLGNYTVF
jgi:hypothetical protein